MYLAKQRSYKSDGSARIYYVLRDSYWDSKAGQSRTRYIGYIGKHPRLTRSKAEQICSDKGIEMGDLENIEELEIVESEHDTSEMDRFVK